MRPARGRVVAPIHRDWGYRARHHSASKPADNVAFTGEALDLLYGTSAAGKRSPEQRLREPLAGALQRLRPGAPDIARNCLLR